MTGEQVFLVIVAVVCIEFAFLLGVTLGIQMAENAFDAAFPELQGKRFRR